MYLFFLPRLVSADNGHGQAGFHTHGSLNMEILLLVSGYVTGLIIIYYFSTGVLKIFKKLIYFFTA